MRISDWSSDVCSSDLPVSLLGAMAVIFALGYSANTITLIALVLAIGVVVDDAILVVENVQRVMEDDPEIGVVEATRTAMGQLTGPIVATTFVLLAVRSEGHTSELQVLMRISYAVFCFKKNKQEDKNN